MGFIDSLFPIIPGKQLLSQILIFGKITNVYTFHRHCGIIFNIVNLLNRRCRKAQQPPGDPHLK